MDGDVAIAHAVFDDLSAWRHGPRLGSAGFTMPDHAFLQGFSLRPGAVPPGIVVHGTPDETGLLLCPAAFKPSGTLAIVMEPSAKRAIVVIGPRCQVYGTLHIVGQHCTVILSGGGAHPSQMNAMLWRDRQLLFWGRDATANGVQIIIHGSRRCVVVGDDCMLANDVTLRASDMHGVVDLATGAQEDCHGDILLEPHVWLGQDVAVLKNVRIGFGSIIGAKALVNRDVPRLVAAGGVPAKVLRRDVSWNRLDEPDPGLLPRLREQTLRLGAWDDAR